MYKSLFRSLFAAFAAGVVTSASATILVDEGFKTGTATGCYSTTDKTSLQNNSGKNYTESRSSFSNER